MSDTQLGIVLRPRNFDEVIDQDATVAAMRSWVDKGEIPRAVMLVGPAGTGKTTLARIFARAAQGWDFPEDQEPEVIEVNAADFRGIDATRDLVDSVQTMPMLGKVRVVILDEAHMLTKESQNLLLKPFEDSNSCTVWVICTTETAKIIKPLVTRCQRFDLKRLTKKGIHTLLARAGEYTQKTEFADFEEVAQRENLNQPRPLLNAFGNYVNGMPPAEAVNGQLETFGADVKDIAFCAVHGSWDKDTMVWGKIPVKAMKTLLKNLEDEFKKRKKSAQAEGSEEEDIEGNDVSGTEAASRPDAARAIKAITGGLLKAELIKTGDVKWAKAISLLAQFGSPANPSDVPLEYPCTIAALIRIMKEVRGA